MIKQLFLTLFALLTVSLFYGQRMVPLIDLSHPLSEPNQGPQGDVYDFTVYNDDLVFVGDFDGVNSNSDTNISRWNGESFVGFEPALPNGAKPYTILNCPLGLVVAGRINSHNHILLLQNGAWTQMANGFDDDVHDLIWYNQTIYACGDFENANGLAVGHIARWSGSSWAQVGSGLNDLARQMILFNGNLHVCGDFTEGGGAELLRIGRVSGNLLVPVGDGLNDHAGCMTIIDDELYVGGAFTATGDGSTELFHVARLGSNGFENYQDNPDIEEIGNLAEIDGEVYAVEMESMGNLLGNKTYRLVNNQLQEHPGYNCVLKTIEFNGSTIAISPNPTYNLIDRVQYQAVAIGKWLSNGTTLHEFQTSKISTILRPGAAQFTDVSNNPGYFTAPFESEAASIYATAPWMAGLTPGGEIHGAFETYGFLEDPWRFYSGPVSNSYDQEYADRYLRLWSIDQNMIEDHIANFDDDTYQTPEVIASWPGNGRYLQGESVHLAPFKDINENGLYEPELGEHPEIKGDKAVFYLLNTSNQPGDLDYGNLNIGVMIYAVENAGTDTDHSLFMQYTIENMSNNPLTDFSFGIWADGDLGNVADDYTGCSPDHNGYFFYNGDDFDETANYAGYEDSIPAQGILFLSDPMTNYIDYLGNEIVGNGIYGAPVTPPHYYNYLNSTWKNGQHMIFGGNGYNTGNPDQMADFMFPSCPNEEGSGEDWWNELSTLENPPGERKGVGATSGHTIQPQERRCFEIALVTAFSNELNNATAAVGVLKDRFDALQSFYDGNLSSCGSQTFPVGIKEATLDPASLTAYPNPTSDLLFLNTANNKVDAITISDQSGRMVMSRPFTENQAISLSALESGLYTLTLSFKGSVLATTKVVKQ